MIKIRIPSTKSVPPIRYSRLVRTATSLNSEALYPRKISSAPSAALSSPLIYLLIPSRSKLTITNAATPSTMYSMSFVSNALAFAVSAPNIM